MNDSSVTRLRAVDFVHAKEFPATITMISMMTSVLAYWPATADHARVGRRVQSSRVRGIMVEETQT